MTHDEPSEKRNRPSTDDKEAAGNDTLKEFEKDEGEQVNLQHNNIQRNMVIKFLYRFLRFYQVSEHDENINDDRSSTHYTSILEHGAINSSKKSSGILSH